MTGELVVQTIDTPRLTADQVIARTRLVREVMEAVMKVDVHYGIIPGTRKPSLWQPGAEKLAMAFRLSPSLYVEDLSGQDERRYRVTVSVCDGSGAPVGAGVGECSSDEEKFKWRRAVSKEEFAATPEDRRRQKYDAKGTTPQVRMQPADVANTVLKMAKKRALVDAIKSSTAASDIFDQDLEDLPEGLEDTPSRTVERPRAKAKPAPAKAPGPSHAAKSKTKAKPAPADDEPDPWDDGAPPLGDDSAGDEEPETVEAEKAGGRIPAEVWEEVRSRWHDKGAISDKQRARLFAIAKSNGWDSDDVTMEIEAHLEVDVTQLPWGDPYNTIVAAFESNRGGDA